MANITKPSGLSNIWAAAGTKIDPGNAKVGLGWVVQLPPYEYQNWVDNRQDAAIAHINQHGVAEWDAVTEYQGNLSYTQGSNGMIYKCLVTHTNKDPINSLNSAFWVLAFESFGSVQVVSDALAAHILNYQTLSAVGNAAAARANLSLYSRVESDARFASLNGSQSQVFAVAPATAPEHAVRLGQVSSLLTQATESNLGVVRIASTGLTESGVDDLTAITPLKANTVYLKKSGNLAGLGNTATARANLGLGSVAVLPSESVLNTANNLSDLASPVTARANLGLTSTATRPETYFLRAGSNLSDLASVSASRTNLGLGSSAVRDIGTLAGTVAAGDDTRIVNAVQTSRQVASGNGLIGGGDLSSNRTLALGTPSTLTVTSTNLVSAESHTHALDLSSFFGSRNLSNPGYYKYPFGLIVQWGSFPIAGETVTGASTVAVTLPEPFTTSYSLQVCFGYNGARTDNNNQAQFRNKTLTGFIVDNQWSGAQQVNQSGQIDWFAVGF